MNIFPHLRSIYWKFLALMIPIMTLAGLLFLGIYSVLIQSKMERELEEKVRLISQVHSLAVAEPLWTLNLEGLERSVETIVVHPEITCAEVLESNELSRYSWPTDCHAVMDADNLYTTNLTFHDQQVGQLKLFYSIESQLESLYREVQIGALLFFLLATVAGVVAFSALKLIVGAPLTKLLKSIENAQQGREDHFVGWSSEDEMGRVIDAYNRMIEQADANTHSLVVAREDAELAAETKARFLANMSHELRTPLNAVIGITEMLREEAQDRNEDTEPHTRVAAAGRHLLGLIDNVLDFSKIEADKIELAPEPTNIRKLLGDLVSTAQPLADRNQNTLNLQVGELPSIIELDPVRFRQVMLNLLGNACKFTTNGKIILSATMSKQRSVPSILFAVADTGIGISEERRRGLFKEFSQADTSTTRHYGGTGLGLAISQRLCALMGSQIEIESSEGEGSVFSFELTIAA